MAKLSLAGGQLVLSLAWAEAEARETIKQISGRRWDSDAKVWCFPEDAQIAERIIVTVKPEVSQEILDWIRVGKQEKQKELVTPLPLDADLLIPWANDRTDWQPEVLGGNPFKGLKDYQRSGVAVMANRARMILADEPGLGKTAQSIATASEYALQSVYECFLILRAGGVANLKASDNLRNFLNRVANKRLEKDEDIDEYVATVWNKASLEDCDTPPVHAWFVEDPFNARGIEFSLNAKSKGRDLLPNEKPYKRTKVKGSIPSVNVHAALSFAPKLVVCPASVKGVWVREISTWLGEDRQIVASIEGDAKSRKKQLQEVIDSNGWAIVNWEQLRVKKEVRKQKYKKMRGGEVVGVGERKVEKTVMREPLFANTPWMVVVADEVHRAKNRKALSSQGLHRTRGSVMLGASGTPILNSPDELWSILHWLYPEQYGRSEPATKNKDAVIRIPYWTFYEQYVEHYEGNFGKVITGVKNPDDLRFELKNRIIRRTKGEVLDLPDKVRQYIPVKMGTKQRKLYDEAEKQMWFEVAQAIEAGDETAVKFAAAAEKDPSSIFQIVNGAARTVRLRQILSSPALLGGEDDSAKLDAAVEIILDAGRQQVVFTEFVGTTHLLKERLEAKGLTCASYTGEVSAKDRTAIEDAFQAGDIDVVIGTIGAMREGITLTAASDEIFLERHWTPSYNEQAEDRCYRIGQNNNVTVRILEGVESVDTQKVRPTNNIKNMIVGSVITKDDVKEVHV